MQVIEFTPIVALLTLCFIRTIMAEPFSHYISETADLHYSKNYINSVLTDFSLKNVEKN
ncbi:hypothetical protein [Bartonella clarridgeiae]|uniref:hypothetical protein n=1 Tax=Bartonella clarridgeiae TaxID=56426 RepID=UPI0002EB90D8|nr:MAG: NADH dehydrogenase subunit N [Bartonella clarridgeiae]